MSILAPSRKVSVSMQRTTASSEKENIDTKKQYSEFHVFMLFNLLSVDFIRHVYEKADIPCCAVYELCIFEISKWGEIKYIKLLKLYHVMNQTFSFYFISKEFLY